MKTKEEVISKLDKEIEAQFLSIKQLEDALQLMKDAHLKEVVENEHLREENERQKAENEKLKAEIEGFYDNARRPVTTKIIY